MQTRASLEHIFGSKVRVRLLKLFLEHPEERFYVREITRRIRSHIHSVRRELANLCRVGLIHVQATSPQTFGRTSRMNRKFYVANPECVIFAELRALLLKGQHFLQEELKREIMKMGSIRYLALTGFFVHLEGFPTDLVVVGRVSKEKCAKLIQEYEEEFGRTINYTILPLKEFMDRKSLMDRFLYNFFEAEKVVLIDSLPAPVPMGI